MSTQTASKNGATAPLANSEKANPVEVVAKQVAGYLERGTLHLPKNYSPDNALKSAYLVLQQTTNSEGKSVLSSCTPASIATCLLDMVIQGLNPAKKQCYFIAYGQKLTCQRGVFGDIALAERVRPGITFYYGVIRKGQKFVTKFVNGKTVIADYEKPFESENAEIIGAYCGALDASGTDMGVDVMTMDRIKKSWAMSKTYKAEAKSGTHHNFEDEMAMRTVVRHYCKPIINSSSDEMLKDSIRNHEISDAEDSLEAEMATSANSVLIDARPALTETASSAGAGEYAAEAVKQAVTQNRETVEAISATGETATLGTLEDDNPYGDED